MERKRETADARRRGNPCTVERAPWTLRIPEEIGKAEVMIVVELEVKEKGLLASGSRETRWTGG